MMSSGVIPPVRTASRSSTRPSLEPSTMYRGRRSTGVPARAFGTFGAAPLALK